MSASTTSLVLLHGWGFNSHIFAPLIPLLKTHFNVVNIDLPGCGNNVMIDSAISLETVTAEVAKKIPSQSIICGWSLGGLIGVSIAKHYPHLVQQLVCVASTPKFCVTNNEWRLGIPQLEMMRFGNNLINNFNSTIEDFLQLNLRGSKLASADIATIKQQILQHPPTTTVLQAYLDILTKADLRQAVASLPQPTSYIFGSLDMLVPFQHYKTIYSLSDKINIFTIKRATHAPFLSNPEMFSSILKQCIIN